MQFYLQIKAHIIYQNIKNIGKMLKSELRSQIMGTVDHYAAKYFYSCKKVILL